MKKNIHKCSKAKCDYYIPMGKAGPLVIQVPVVIADMKIAVPLSLKININSNCRYLKTSYNKVFLSKLNLNSKNELLLEGYVIKSLVYYNNYNKKFTTNFKIPIDEKIIVNFNQKMICTNETVNSDFQCNSESVKYNIQSLKILSDSISKIKDNYIGTLVLSINIIFTQTKNVFIQEPEGDVVLLNNDSNPPVLNCYQDKDFYYTVGYNPGKGLFAQKNVLK